MLDHMGFESLDYTVNPNSEYHGVLESKQWVSCLE